MLSLFTQSRREIWAMVKTKKKKVGAPRGVVNNPLGVNQYKNVRADKPIAVRLLKEKDAAIRQKAEKEGKTLTQVIEEAVELYLGS